MKHARHLIGCLTLAAALITSSCVSPPDVVEAPPQESRYWWKGDGVKGKPRIVINLSEQRVFYYKGGELVGVSPISSGREGNGTVNGKYSIIEKDLHHRSSLFGAYLNPAGDIEVGDVDTRIDPKPPGTTFLGANMRYFMRIVGGIGMHEGYLPGYPASHGCIRLPTKMAAIFFRETPMGTPVEIVGHGSLASSEAAIPIGDDTALVLADAPVPASAAPVAETRSRPRYQEVAMVETRARTSKPQETVRRAVVPMKKRLKKLRYGETLFLEE